jgi:hypothetical protein
MTWLYIWVIRRVSYKKQELLTLRKYLSSSPDVGGVRVAHFFYFVCVVLKYVFTFWFHSCDFHYDFHIKTVSGSSLVPGGGPMSYLCYLCLLAHSGVQQIVCCVFVLFCSSCCQFLWIVHLLIAPSVFSIVYLQ